MSYHSEASKSETLILDPLTLHCKIINALQLTCWCHA